MSLKTESKFDVLSSFDTKIIVNLCLCRSIELSLHHSLHVVKIQPAHFLADLR